MKPKKIYISGAISSRQIHEAKAHFKAAHDILIHDWYNVVNPFEIGTNQHFTWQANMSICIPALCDCDAIYMLRGWWKSKGAIGSIILDKMLGLEVNYE